MHPARISAAAHCVRARGLGACADVALRPARAFHHDRTEASHWPAEQLSRARASSARRRESVGRARGPVQRGARRSPLGMERPSRPHVHPGCRSTGRTRRAISILILIRSGALAATASWFELPIALAMPPPCSRGCVRPCALHCRSQYVPLFSSGPPGSPRRAPPSSRATNTCGVGACSFHPPPPHDLPHNRAMEQTWNTAEQPRTLPAPAATYSPTYLQRPRVAVIRRLALVGRPGSFRCPRR